MIGQFVYMNIVAGLMTAPVGFIISLITFPMFIILDVLNIPIELFGCIMNGKFYSIDPPNQNPLLGDNCMHNVLWISIAICLMCILAKIW